MALKGQSGIGIGHATAVVNDLNAGASRVNHQYVNGPGTGIHGILHQFLDNRCGALYHLACCYLVGHTIGQ